MKRILAATAALTLLTATPAKADLDAAIQSLFVAENKGCDTQVKLKLGEAIKKGINDEVLRREKAIKNPIALEAMSCLDNLMAVNLDFAIRVPNIQGMFAGAVSDATNRLCSMANDKLAELTGPLQEALNFDPFEAINIPGLSGGGSTNDVTLATITLGTPSAGGGNQTATTTPREQTAGSLTERSLEELFGSGSNGGGTFEEAN